MTKKALFLAGGWEGHEPEETSRFISNEIEKYDIENKCEILFSCVLL